MTDMKHAIQYALTYPDRRENCLAPLDLTALSRLDFEEPDLDRFACLRLAYEALRTGGTMPAALNAANEIAVQAFLDGKIGFAGIAAINERTMSGHTAEPVADIATVLRVDQWAREAAKSLLAENATSATI
jgi:1-deoxy-D-xylulose-5-phosphate reductoisomerase